MSTPTFLDVLLAILLGLSQPVSPVPPVETGADATPVQPQPAAAPVCARRIDRAAPGLARAVAELTAGPAAITGEVTFVFEQMQGTNQLRHRVSDEVRIGPGARVVHTIPISVNDVTDPEVRAILPDGTTLPCHCPPWPCRRQAARPCQLEIARVRTYASPWPRAA
jgi:hypothetical protein